MSDNAGVTISLKQLGINFILLQNFLFKEHKKLPKFRDKIMSSKKSKLLKLFVKVCVCVCVCVCVVCVCVCVHHGLQDKMKRKIYFLNIYGIAKVFHAARFFTLNDMRETVKDFSGVFNLLKKI